MTRLIYTYALIKSLYDQGEDYLDSFWAFAIQCLGADGYSDVASLQECVKQKCDLEIPRHVLGTILKRARRRGYLEYRLEWSEERRREMHKLTEKGLRYLDTLETQEEVERRISALLDDMVDFYSDHNLPLNTDQILGLLLSVLQENIQPLKEYINPSIVSELPVTEISDKEKILIEYLRIAEKQKPEKYQTIQDMLLGSVITTILFTEESADISDIAIRRFRHCVVFLDTNFVFSLLDLRHDIESNEAAQELLNLMVSSGFTVKLFDFTVDEMSRVLSSYFQESHRYASSVEVDDVCSCLKKKGWSKTQVLEFIANLEGSLNKLGIGIELRRTINLKTYQPKDNELRSLLWKYKPNQRLLPQNHDLVAIECTEQYRGQSVRQIERCKALFLTSDIGLSRFNFIEMGHKDNRTVSEVILDRLLTNILWLKNPRSKPPLKSIIASYSRNLFVKSRVWSRFYEVLQELRKEEKIQDENISMLFYHGYIEDALSHFEDHEAGQITQEFVLTEIEKAAKLVEEETAKMISEKEKDFLKQLKERVSIKEQEKEREWLERLQEIKSNIRNGAKRSAKNRMLALRSSVAAILAIPLIYCLFTGNWEAYNNIVGILASISFIVGVVIGSIPALWERLEDKWFHKITVNRIKESGLDKYE